MPTFNPTLLGFTGDPQDFLFSPTLTTLPNVVDLRGYADYVEDQAQLGSCTANSVVSACELVLKANNQFVNLSRIFNFYESRVFGDLYPSTEGAYLRDAISAAKNVGLPPESIWPYDATKVNTVPTQEAYDAAAAVKITRYERIWEGFTYTYDAEGHAVYGSGTRRTNTEIVRDIKAALAEGYPVIIGFPLSSQFQQVAGTFEYQYLNQYKGITDTNPSIGGHAVVIIGYNDNFDSFIVENSWGSTWGYAGFGLFPYNTVVDIQEAWVIKSVNNLKVPNPTTNPVTNTPSIDTRYYVPVIRNPVTDPVYFFNGVYQMAITSPDLVWRKSALVSDTPAQNGGAMSFATTITTNVKNNLFPDVSQSERIAGSVVFRKLFLHVNKNSTDELLNANLSLGAVTPAEDFVVFYEGTPSDTEAGMAVTRPYGAGSLAADIGAGATTLTVTAENIDWATANEPFQVGDTICISDGTNTDYVVASAVTYGADISLTVGATTHAFLADSVVASVYQVPSTKASYTAPAVTSTAGTYTSSDNLIVNDKGCADQTWTVTFTNATNYTVSGNTIGLVGAGVTASDFTANNTSVATPFFTLKSIGFGGTYEAGDTIVFNTTAAAIPIWMCRVVPSGTADVSNNFATLNLSAESY